MLCVLCVLWELWPGVARRFKAVRRVPWTRVSSPARGPLNDASLMLLPRGGVKQKTKLQKKEKSPWLGGLMLYVMWL